MRSHCRPNTHLARFRTQQSLSEMKEILVHSPLQRKSYFSRLVVRTLHQAHRGSNRNQRIKILFGAKKICLHAHANIRIGLTRATIELERDVHVRALLDINPESFFRGSVCDECYEMGVA